MYWKLAAPEFKSDLFPLCRKGFKQFRSIVCIERKDPEITRPVVVVATKIALDRSRMTKIKSKLAGAPFPVNYEQDKNCRFFFNILTDFPDSITNCVVIQTKTNIHSHRTFVGRLKLLLMKS